MEIIKKLNIPAAFLYDKIVDAVLFDIKKQTGRQLSKKQLPNFEYIKAWPDSSQAKIKVESIMENRAYHFRTSTVRHDVVVYYDIQPLDAETCQLRYREETISFSSFHKLNAAITGKALAFLKRRHVQKKLTEIEMSY